MIAATPAKPRGLAFVALKHSDFRFYVSGACLSMMADNIEHVITYWVLWEKFHSPLLAGFAVISHWTPFLLFSVYFGALADRYDCRRVIQASQGLFMAVSVSWGVLFLTGRLEMWHAAVLLVFHGLAAALWNPGEQLILHDIVGRDHLESAVRLNATGRQLGILFGPAVGGGLLLLAGPVNGIFMNALIYLPLSLSLLRIKANGHQQGTLTRKTSLASALQTLSQASSNRAILAVIAMAGIASFFIGNYVPQMPALAGDLGGSNAERSYTMLLLASGIGGVLGGLVLEASGAIKVSLGSALAGAVIWGAAIAGFALTRSYAAALVFLFIGGTAQLAFSSIAQTIVQLQAPPDLRGRLVGAFSMAQSGMKTGCGLTVGVAGSIVGVHTALGVSAISTAVLALGMFAFGSAAPSPTPAY
ncbi:MAG TPA: MFS transporter, partial [Chloroflexota bacterium]|nr:MFS transporter [Chloroflexota bacterium]